MNEYAEIFLRQASPASRSIFAQRLRMFFGYVERQQEVQELSQLTPQRIEAWIVDLRARKMKPASVYAYVSTVRRFFAVLHREGYLQVNPWPDYITTKRPEYSLRVVPTPKATAELLEAADDAAYPCRTRAILEVAYGCGLRRMELRNLNVSDVLADSLRIRGKGGKERIVPLGTAARTWLEKYQYGERLQIVKKYNPLEDALFVSELGRRLSLPSYSLILRKLGASKGLSLHSLRHACATHMLRNGASVLVLQKLLGHSSVNTTQLYTRVETSDLLRLLDKYHPRP
ncbi:MAG: tyrosine-type recombinase/integrase [Chitinispirillaceae bacterium]|nr:tyrosine-type recombinase/integrase [Chitinispirillaceae bacterium]